MMPGRLTGTATGGLVLHIEAERYRITPDDVRALIFSGRPAPIFRERVRRASGAFTGEVTIEGYAALNAAGRAVVIRTGEGIWMIPAVSLRHVACGEAASAPLFMEVVI